jgi:membrane dipeptidase
MKRGVAILVLASCAACAATGGAVGSPGSSPVGVGPPLASVAASASLPAPPAASAPAPAASLTLEARAAALHAESIVIDTHDDVTSYVREDGFDLGAPNLPAQTDLAKMRAGGITAEFFSIWVDTDYEHPSEHDAGAARRALELIDATYQQVERHPNELVLATSADGIRSAKQQGKIAVLMGIEGGQAIEDSLFALREFYRLGVRYMTLTHSTHNDWADSAGVGAKPLAPRHHGLTPFGEDVVREMQRIGMLVDVSHVSDETLAAVLRVAKAPIIASHSSARALCDVPRNLGDDQLRAIASNGGVVMVNFFSMYLDPHYRTAAAEFHAKHPVPDAPGGKGTHTKTSAQNARFAAAERDIPKPPLSLLVDHIEHIAKVAGVDHVGLGSDFDGVWAMPEGLEGIDGLPKITLELLRRGWSDEDVRKVLGQNFLRAMSAAEAYARSTGTTLSGDGKGD